MVAIVPMQNARQSDLLKTGLRSLLAGILTTMGLMLPLGLFGSLFWNFWHQDGRAFAPRWDQIARETVAITLLSFLSWWWMTLPVVLALSYCFFRRRISRGSPRQGHAPAARQ